MDPHRRERTAHEKRRWVRLTRICNNCCRFCLDAHNVMGDKVRAREVVEQEIREGIRDGCERLILSGGEPTIHPDYLAFVELGSRLGYRWIQTVSNGRMFAYRRFAEQATGRGLREATFSMHGHEARLHDHLVGVDGAFEQSLRGMDNLRALGAVVNVDVVITARNVAVLPDILRFFQARGVTEFDLLWMVPFGRAWDNREDLFPHPPDALPHLQEAIRVARAGGAVVWTNRLPAQLLEGTEDLIQDPYKLHDEIRGRKPEFDQFLQGGQPLMCREPERCAQCFVAGFCRELERTIEARARGVVPAVRVGVGGATVAARRMRLVADDVVQAARFVRGMVKPPAEVVLELSGLGRTDPYAADFGAARLVRVASGYPDTLDALLDTWTGGDLEVVLNRSTATWIAKREADIRAAADRVLVSLESFLALSGVQERGTNPAEALRPLRGANLRLVDIPACSLPGSEVSCEEPAVPVEALPGSETSELARFTDHYILRAYRVHSLRCGSCARRPGCPGMPINHVRLYGFRILQPLES